MIIDARSLSDGMRIDCDIAIVGSGAAGLTLAVSLLEGCPNLNIVIAEAGGARHSNSAQTRFFSQERLEPSTHADLTQFRRRQVGGSTTIWGGRCLPYTADDFDARPDLMRPGWPIPFAEVAAAYPEAMRMLDAGAADFSARTALPDLPAELAPANGHPDLLLDGIERYSLPTNVARKYREQIAASQQVRLFTNAVCLTLLDARADEGRAHAGTAEGARGLLLKAGDKILSVNARKTVVAVGGLETARLLLWSGQQSGAPFGNSHDNVGRYYMTHVVNKSAWLRFTCPLDKVQLDYVTSHDGVWVRRLIQMTSAARQRLGLMNFAMRPVFPTVDDPGHGNPILSAVYLAKKLLIPEYARIMSELLPEGEREERQGPAVYGRHLFNIAKGSPELARFVYRWLRLRTFARRKLPSIFVPNALGLYPLETIVEQIPDAGSRIVLGATTDPNGVPRMDLTWKAGPEFDTHLLRIYDSVDRALAEAGIGRLTIAAERRSDILRYCYPQAGHHIGTARMSARPSDGVVDGNLRVWDTPNLYVLSSAVFPTASYANPTLTVVALARRLASHLTQTLKSVTAEVPADNRSSTDGGDAPSTAHRMQPRDRSAVAAHH